MSRLGPSVDGSLTTLGVVAAGVVALSIFALQSGSGAVAPIAANGLPSTTTTTTTTTNSTGKPGAKTGKSGSGSGSNGSVTNDPGKPGVTGPGTSDSCNASNNGGSTDRGVTATKIKLGATIVKSGIGATLLGPVSTAIQAVRDQVNASGGICGRLLDIKLKDDGWDKTRGFGFIQNLVQDDKVFALAVNPSSEGLALASENHYLTKTKTPVVGSDGMLNAQYTDPWIWPVAASTASTMRIMAADACTRFRAQNFGIVFDTRYRFGVEGATAFNDQVKKCTGHDIPGYANPPAGCPQGSRYCAISAGDPSYDTQNKSFNESCFGNKVTPLPNECNFIALLLEPNEALNFMRNGFSKSPRVGLAQTLFTKDFASSCGTTCNGFNVWTGYNPPIEEFAALPAVKQYVATVRRADPNADILNQFVEGGYGGMLMLVEALKRVGATLTRDRLAATLDSMDLNLGLTTPLSWRPGNHYANVAMQAFSIQYQGGFNGFRNVTTWVRDPNFGKG